jgi:hypothetical protein
MRIVTFVNYLIISPSNEELSNQHPLADHTQARVIAQPTPLADVTSPPEPFIPPSAPDDFKCKYPNLKDYSFCSTYGDRSCWLKSSDPKKLSYDINTNYETEFPEGIVRKVYPPKHRASE